MVQMYEIFSELIKIFFKILYFEVTFRILALDTEMKGLGGTSFLSCSVSMSAFKGKPPLSLSPTPSLCLLLLLSLLALPFLIRRTTEIKSPEINLPFYTLYLDTAVTQHIFQF